MTSYTLARALSLFHFSSISYLYQTLLTFYVIILHC